MPFGVFKAALLGSGAGGEAFYIGLLMQTDSDKTLFHQDHAADSDGNLYVLGSNNSSEPMVIKLDYDASGPSVGASAGDFNHNMSHPQGAIAVRDDGKVVVGWNNGSNTYRYFRLNTSLQLDSGNIPDNYWSAGYSSAHSWAGKGKCITSASNVEYVCFPDYYNYYAWAQGNAAVWNSSNTYINTFQQSQSTGELPNMVSVDDDSTQFYVCCTDVGQSKATVVGLNCDGSSGWENFPITGSSHQYWSATYNANPANSGSAGYFAATMRAPTSDYGIVIGKATSADTPNSLAWSRKYVTSSSYTDTAQGISNIVTDSSGNVYIAWKQRVLANFGPAGTVGYPIFVASWESDGTHRWSRTLYSVGSSSFFDTDTTNTPGLSITPDDNLVITTQASWTQTGGSNREGTLIARVPNDGSLQSDSAVSITDSDIADCNAYWSEVPSGLNFSESAGGLTTGSEADSWGDGSDTPSSSSGSLDTTYAGKFVQSGDL